MTGPGDADLDKKGEGARDNNESLAPSTRSGMAGEGGLLVAEELLLPESWPSTISKTPSLCSFAAGWTAGGEVLPDGVPKKQNFWINSWYSADWRSGFSEVKESGRVPGTGAPVV